jgi:ABC-type transporter Mla subunit MlaD
MPATKTKPTVTARANESAQAKTQDDARVIDHVSQALEAAHEDLASIGGSLGAGARYLRKDVERLLRVARRDLKETSKALQRDLKHLQKDLTKTPVKSARARGRTGSGQDPAEVACHVEEPAEVAPAVVSTKASDH